MAPRHPYLERARAMRREPTEAERQLWIRLRFRQIAGARFRRQRPVGPYIVDFVCPEFMLVVELDGSQHADQESYDAARSAFLEAMGYEVVRFWNSDIFANPGEVVETIRVVIARRRDRDHNPPLSALRAPSPASGPLAALGAREGMRVSSAHRSIARAASSRLPVTGALERLSVRR